QSDEREDCRTSDQTRLKPVLFLALVEDQLKRTESNRHQCEAQSIDSSWALVTNVRWILDEDVCHEDCKNAHWNIDIKDPAPRIIVGDPAAKRWPYDWSYYYTHPEHGHRLTPLLLGK